MNGNIKEIYVGAVLTKDRDGNEKSTPIFLHGRPVPAGIYTPDNLPPGRWTWDKGERSFVAAVMPHNGHGIDIVYEGDETPKKTKAKSEPSKEVNE